MERQKIDLSEERRILCAMITSTTFLCNLKNVAYPKLFQSTYSKTIAKWIWEYYDHTDEAPQRAIEEIYLKKQKNIKEDESDLIADFLTKLSKDWEKPQIQNVDYTTKNAIDYFKLQSLKSIKNKIEDAIKNNDSAYGERLISEYRKIDKIRGSGINLLEDAGAIKTALTQEHEYLFNYPGELGKAIGQFNRGDFFAIMGAMKKGKSHYLWYTAYRALMTGLKVCFFSLEMTENQMLRRMWHTMMGQPFKTDLVAIPEFVRISGEMFDVVLKEKSITGMDTDEIQQKQIDYKKYIRTGGVKLITYPSHNATTNDIETELINSEYYDNYMPDVVVVDYADLLKPEHIGGEYRHQLDNIWKNLRGLATKRNILVVTGTQTSRKGLKYDVDAFDVAEDVRKMAHVTQMIALNQSKEEKKDGIMRIETVAQREGEMFLGQMVVLQCYKIGRPYIDSKDRKFVNMEKYEKKKEKEEKK